MKYTRKQLLEMIMSNLGSLHRSFATTRDGFLANFKLSRPQVDLLFSLKHGQRSTGELAKHFSVTSSAISQMVDQLETKGLVERLADSKDRRITYVKLADTTHEVFEKMRSKFINHLSQRFEDVSIEELEALLKILSKIVDNVGKDTTWKR